LSERNASQSGSSASVNRRQQLRPIVIQNRRGLNGIVGTNLVYGCLPHGQTLPFAADELIE
jgi:hypothetical protein